MSEIKVPDYNEYIGTIYMFVNDINGKIYIGQTITKFYSRFCNHHGDSFTKQDNLPFHKAIRKYGWENFSKYILWQDEIVYESNKENKEIVRLLLNKKEEEYIQKYKSNNSKYGYNLTSGGIILPNSAHTKESIEKAKTTKAKNGTNHMLGKTYDKHHLAKPILQYDLNKNFIKKWTCVKLAEDTLGFSILPRNITSGNYFWTYDVPNKDEIIENKYKSWVQIDYKPGVPKVVFCFDLFGELIGSYNSVTEAGKIHGIGAAQIANVAKLKELGNVVRDYIWIYEEDYNEKEFIIETIRNKSKIYKSKYKPIYQIFLNGEIIKLWDNFESIIDKYPKAKASINKCLNGVLNVYSNCFWIYENEYSDELLIEKLDKFKKTKKKLVNDIISGKIKYEGINILHDTNSNKNYLKEHPCIYQFDQNYNLIKKWENYNDVKLEGMNFANISKCLRRKLKTAYGFIWRYEEDVINNNLT